MIKYSIGDFSKLIGRTVNCLQRWDRDGILVAQRTDTNRRFYTYDQYIQVKDKGSVTSRIVIAYCRVEVQENSNGSDEGLKEKKRVLKDYAKNNGLNVDQWIEDIANAHLLQSEGLEMLLELVLMGRVSTVITLHNNHLGAEVIELFKMICKLQGVYYIELDAILNKVSLE